jgi:hypothetical protein
MAPDMKSTGKAEFDRRNTVTSSCSIGHSYRPSHGDA